MPLLYDRGNTGSEKFRKVSKLSGTNSGNLGRLARNMGRTRLLLRQKEIRAMRARRYLRQNVGVNSTRTLKISNRPSSIASVQIQV